MTKSGSNASNHQVEVSPAIANHTAIASRLTNESARTSARNHLLSGGELSHYTSTNPVAQPGFIQAGISADSSGSAGVAQRKHNLEVMKQFAANQPSGGGRTQRKRTRILRKGKKTRPRGTRKHKRKYRGGYRYSRRSKKQKKTRPKRGGNKTKWGCYS